MPGILSDLNDAEDLLSLALECDRLRAELEEKEKAIRKAISLSPRRAEKLRQVLSRIAVRLAGPAPAHDADRFVGATRPAVEDSELDKERDERGQQTQGRPFRDRDGEKEYLYRSSYWRIAEELGIGTEAPPEDGPDLVGGYSWCWLTREECLLVRAAVYAKRVGGEP